MYVRQSGVKVGLGAVAMGALALILAAGCGVDAESNTGIRINVTYHESVPPAAADGFIDHLRFYVAVRYDDSDQWVLNSAGAGVAVDVADRNLFADPYQLFLARKDGRMRSIRVVVVGERDGVGVLFGQLANPTAQDFQAGSIVQRTITLRPPETSFDLSWTVANCLTSSTMRNEEYEPFIFVDPNDRDCDTYTTDEDCDDQNPEVNPGVEEGYECDGVDNNCDGVIDPHGDEDNDLDGFTSCQGDCNDSRIDINPNAPEICDGLDNDCNKKCDESPDLDMDGDGFTLCGTIANHEGGTCGDAPAPDCDDNNPDVNPGAIEDCNGIDDNCNGECDETWDPDGDGYTECGSKDGSLDYDFCLDALNPDKVDCDPLDPMVHPDQEEWCDGYDSNCDGAFSQDNSVCYVEGSYPGECYQGDMTCVENGGGDRWGTCSSQEGEPSPYDRCGIWPRCLETLSPAACMEQSIDTSMNLMCHLQYASPDFTTVCGGASGQLSYGLPFGFSGNTNCTWHLLLWDPSAMANYQQIGLVDPNNPGSPPTTLLQSCEASLVALPMTVSNADPSVEGVLSFYYDNGPGGFYAMEMFVSINPVNMCDQEGPLDCWTVVSP